MTTVTSWCPPALHRAEYDDLPMEEPLSDRLLTTMEVAARCRTTPSTVRYWRHIGYGPTGFKVGKRVLYREVDLATWLDQQHRRAAPAARAGAN